MEELEVEIGTSCLETWEEMTTTGCNRHCAACDKVIHDLEQMTGGDAAALLESGEEVCVRAQISASGRVKLADNGATRPIRVTITISEPSAFVSAPNYGDGPVNCFGHFLVMMKPADPPERA